MTRERIFGSDVPFMAWIRAQKDLPSFSATIGFVATDVDLFCHRYLTVVDKIGTREVQCLMLVEVKTRGGKPSVSQLDTLQKIDAFRGAKRLGGQAVRNFGVFILSLDGTEPADFEMRWSRVGGVQRSIDVRTLIRLLRFEVDPRTLRKLEFRRHHRTRVIERVTMTELGFQTAERRTRRS